MLANFASSAEGSGSNSSVTTSVVGGADSGTSVGNSLGATTTNADQKEGESKRQQIPYSMPGVLHYLQHEWNFYELERARWENDRAELKARISFLMGERKAQENLKHDLMRRIKMLEYALKQERARFQQFVENNDGQQNVGAANNSTNDGDERTHAAAISASKSAVPLDIDAIVPPTNLVLNNNAEKQHEVNLEWVKARETLRQYLQEIGYTDKILDVRSFRVKSLLGLVPENAAKSGIEVGSAERALAESEQFILDTADAIKHNRVQGIQQSMLQSPNKRGGIDEEDSDSSSGGDAEADLDIDAVEAINEFSFLKKAMDNSSSGKEMAKGIDSMNNDPKSLKTIKENLKKEQQQRRQQNIAQAKQNSKDEQNLSKFAVPASLMRNISVDTVHGMPPNTVQSAEQVFEDEKFEGIKAGFGEDDDDQTQRWNIRYTLRSHYDSIRAMQFHPVEPVLITASEDGTAKLWDLNHSALGGQKSGSSTNDGSGKGSQFPQQPATGIVDIEPIYTFRGHTGPILAMDLSPLGENCYTAGLDGVISCWTVPSVAGLDIYQNFDRNILQERLRGHTDAVWSLCFHSSSNRLISASSDGTIRIWIVGLADGAMPSPLLKTISEVDRPHSIDLVSTESQQLVSACAYAKCHIRDFETGQIVTQFQMNDNNGEDGPPGEINKILSHPTMPVTITAGEDRKIRFFDNNTGKLINSTMAHVEGVSTLAIESNGLYMLSASHDGSVRLWNAEKRICLQEIAAHRKKSGSGVMTVAFHPSRQLIGSAGADSLAKVYGNVRSSPRSSLIATASPPSSLGSSGASSLVGSPQKHQHTASSQL